VSGLPGMNETATELSAGLDMLAGPGDLPDDPDQPRRPVNLFSVADRIFFGGGRAVGLLVLIIFGSIGLFLAYQSIPTLRHYGLHFFTETQWLPESDRIGIAAVVVGTVVVAVISLVIAFPLALTTALYISEYAPLRIRGVMVAMVDLMAAVPSIVYGLWGFFLLQPRAAEVAHWLHQHLGFIPFFRADTDPNAAVWEQSRYYGSAFIAGLVVSMMVIPMGCAVMREVFSQAPQGEKEAALALGATRWGMVRTVVLTFGRGGIIGGTMLSLGRALGETIAVLLIISPTFEIKASITEIGSNTVAALIAGRFGEATAAQLSALLTAGLVLFLITLLMNTLAATVVSRSRSGAATEI
jgi:phosphate transport system permease protein